MTNLDYMCISESWMNQNTIDLINIPGYRCYRRDREERVGSLYIIEQFKCEEQHVKVNLEYLVVTNILSQTMRFDIIVIYNRPSHDVKFYNELKNLLTPLDIVCGDF